MDLHVATEIRIYLLSKSESVSYAFKKVSSLVVRFVKNQSIVRLRVELALSSTQTLEVNIPH